MFSDDFESGDFTAWTGILFDGDGVVTASDEDAYHGTYSMKCYAKNEGSHARAYIQIPESETAYSRFYFKLDYLPASEDTGIQLLAYTSSDDTLLLVVGVRYETASGGVCWWISYQGTDGWHHNYPATPTIAVDTWYCVNVGMHIGTSTGWLLVEIDDTTIFDQSGLNTNNKEINQVDFGIRIENYNLGQFVTVYEDSCVVDDAYIGPAIEYTLNLNVVGNGAVTLNYTGPYFYGDVVELTADPDEDWTFTDWSGDLTGSTNPEIIAIDGDKTITATFTQP